MELKTILTAIKEATGINPVAFSITDETPIPAISYTFYRDGDNGAAASYRLQTRITAPDYATAIGLEEKLVDCLVCVGDEHRFGCSIEANGGGSLLDLETGNPQIINYFDLVSRS